MRSISFILTLLFLIGCSESPSPYSPAAFRGEIEQLIRTKRYGVAIAYVRSADPERQAVFDRVGYLAVGEDMIVLPGVYPRVSYSRSRDWFIPGTSDAIENAEWQRVATEFATAITEGVQAAKPVT